MPEWLSRHTKVTKDVDECAKFSQRAIFAVEDPSAKIVLLENLSSYSSTAIVLSLY